MFLRDARVSLDNNASERVLRGPVIARHTCFGSGGPDGARVAGLMFGVFATLRLAGLIPYTWVLEHLGACADNRGRPPRFPGSRLGVSARHPQNRGRRDWLGKARDAEHGIGFNRKIFTVATECVASSENELAVAGQRKRGSGNVAGLHE